jgi:hypothetical protein
MSLFRKFIELTAHQLKIFFNLSNIFPIEFFYLMIIKKNITTTTEQIDFETNSTTHFMTTINITIDSNQAYHLLLNTVRDKKYIRVPPLIFFNQIFQFYSVNIL